MTTVDQRPDRPRGDPVYTDFSFGRLLRHLDGVEPLTRLARFPTEEHMRKVIEGYVANLNQFDPGYVESYLAVPRRGEDPVGTRPITITGEGDDVMSEMSQLLDVPFRPLKAEMTAPPTFSMGDKAAFSFRLWAEVDGRDLTIDIIEVVTFDEDGKIAEQLAYWGADNVTLLP
jgi:steroid delta-isomerase